MKAVTLAFFIATISPIFSQTVTVSGVEGFTGQFRDSNNEPLPFGSVVRVGAFDLSGDNAATLQNSDNFQEIEALFTPLAESEVGSGSIVQASNTGDTIIVNDFIGEGNTLGQIEGIAAGYLPIDTQLFFWVFNASDPALATEWAIATSDSASFELPAFPGSTTLTPEDVNIIFRGSQDGANVLLAPIEVIPEPSSFLLTSIGLSLLIGRRRRAC